MRHLRYKFLLKLPKLKSGIEIKKLVLGEIWNKSIKNHLKQKLFLTWIPRVTKFLEESDVGELLYSK